MEPHGRARRRAGGGDRGGATRAPRPADLLVNATSVGLRAASDLARRPAGLVDRERGRRPRLRQGADSARAAGPSERGARVVDGLEVLVRQGARSLTVWTGRRRPLDVMRRADVRVRRLGRSRPGLNMSGRLPICQAMAISRPFLLALLGVVLLGATVFARHRTRAQGSRRLGVGLPARRRDPGSTPAQATPEPTAPAAPRQLLVAGLRPDALEQRQLRRAPQLRSGGGTRRTLGLTTSGRLPEWRPEGDAQGSTCA